MAFIKKHKITIIGAIITAVLSFVLVYSQVLYSFDKLISDPLFQTPSAPNHSIKIIAIDEKTVAAYGEYTDWNRDIPAELVELLSKDSNKAPSVIAFDIIYTSERDEASDRRFAAACKSAGNVITAVNLVYRTGVSLSGGELTVDENNISMVEYPYEGLREAVGYGFANTYIDKDQFVRQAGLKADHSGETIYSFPASVYLKYCDAKGIAPVLPKTDGKGIFGFKYTGVSGSYEVISLCDVLDGTVDPSVFAGGIVLVGAYSPGMQDNYNAAVQHGQQMYGVEIQANILQAIIDGNTVTAVSPLFYALAVAFVAAFYFVIVMRVRVVVSAFVGVGFIAADVAAAKLLFMNGYMTCFADLIIVLLLIYFLHLIFGYMAEAIKRRRILNAFKKYVAPQVVEEVAGKGNFSVKLGGEKRHIAVLFVDIRGFTTMSEGLQPEQVVEILNEYLALTTSAIFKNHGTLDKFIGDATMAVFNAPFDLDDYIYRAVCAARDIAAGSAELEKKLRERFGKSVSFGIGVNCGDAVVGNIGCDVRMDYTAIGDTVNTASRLESNAGRGQILISKDVYEAVKDRVEVTEIGVIPLKGKKNEIFVYQLDKVL